MSGLSSIAFADIASRRFSSALTVVAILLGTAVVVATFTINVAVEGSMRQAATALVGNADLVIESLDDQGFASTSVPAVAALPGVTVVAPEVQKRAFYRGAGKRGFVEILGIDPALDPQIREYRVAAGRFFEAGDGRVVLLGKDWAATSGIDLGDDIDLITTEGFQPFRVVGLLDEADVSQRGAGGLVRVPLTVAQSAFGFGDRVLSLGLKVVDPSQVDDVKAGLERVLPYVFTVRDSSQVLEDLLASIREFQVALYFFGLIALLAGSVLVFNSLSLQVAERTQELGLLRAVGASTGFVVRLTLLESLVLGLAGAFLGLVLGSALAVGIVLAIGRTQGIPVTGLPFSPLGAAIAFVLGVGVTLVASLVPAFRAGRTSPLEAMGASPAGMTTGRRRGRGPIAAVAALALAILAVLPIEGDAARIAKAVGLLLLLPLFIYLSQFVIPILAAVAASPVRRISRGVGIMAERTIRRDRGQTTLTVASFLISLALIVGLSNGATSFTSAGQQWAAALFPGELVVVSPVDQPLELMDEFATLPGVDQVSAVSSVPVAWKGLRLTGAGVAPSHYFQAFEFEAGERTEAFRQMRRGEGILIPAALAKEMDLGVGDPMTLTVGDASGDFTISGIITHSLPTPDNFGAVILPRDAVEGTFGIRTFRFLAVSAAPDADLAQLSRDLASTAESYGMEAHTQAELAQSIGNGVGGLLGLLAGLVAIGVVIGSLGLINTMMLNIAQRAREIGLLRAVGMARRQVRSLAIAEAAIMGFLGAILGVALGAFITWVLVDLGRTADLDPRFSFSIPLALAVIVAGIGIAIVASLYPSSRAARTDILQTLRQ